jgi:hypothetical protein
MGARYEFQYCINFQVRIITVSFVSSKLNEAFPGFHAKFLETLSNFTCVSVAATHILNHLFVRDISKHCDASLSTAIIVSLS